MLTWLQNRHGVRVTADVVERHDPEQFERGRMAPYFVRHRWTTIVAARFADQMIVISSHLANRYHRISPEPLVVPPLVDLDEYPEHVSGLGEVIELLYVGNPQGKDQLGVVMDAIRSMPPEKRERLRFTIAGADEDALKRNPDVGPERVRAMGPGLIALGYVDRQRVLHLLSTSDFSIVIRPDAGYANAGFPSKVSESLAAGCPLICNVTSDLGEYLSDGRNALLCSSTDGSSAASQESIADVLSRALGLSPLARHQMSREARVSAESFSTATWGRVLNAWLRG